VPPGRTRAGDRVRAANWQDLGHCRVNGTSAPLPLDLDLASFNTFTKRYAITEGKNASLQVIATRLPNADHWQHMVPPRGGFLLRLEKSEREIGN